MIGRLFSARHGSYLKRVVYEKQNPDSSGFCNICVLIFKMRFFQSYMRFKSYWTEYFLRLSNDACESFLEAAIASWMEALEKVST